MPKTETKNINPQEFLNNMLFPVAYGPDWQDIQKEKAAWGKRFQSGEKPEGVGDVTWSQVTQSPVYQYDKGPDVPVTAYTESSTVDPTAHGLARYYVNAPDIELDDPSRSAGHFPVVGIDVAGISTDPLWREKEGLENIPPRGDDPFEQNWQLSPFSVDDEGRSQSAIHGDWYGGPVDGQRMWMTDADSTLGHELGHVVGLQSAYEQHKDKGNPTNWYWYARGEGDETLTNSLSAGREGISSRNAEYLAIPMEADQRNMEFIRRMATTKEVVDPKTGEKTWAHIPGNELTSEGRENRNIIMTPEDFDVQWKRFGEYLESYEKENPKSQNYKGLDSHWSKDLWDAIEQGKGKDGSYYEYLKYRAPSLMETRPKSLPENIMA